MLGEGLEDAKRSKTGLIKRRRKERMRRSKAKPTMAVSVTVCRHFAKKVCLPLLRRALKVGQFKQLAHAGSPLLFAGHHYKEHPAQLRLEVHRVCQVGSLHPDHA